MAGEYIGKESDHQAERLGEHTDYLYQGHQRKRDLEPGRNLGPKDVFPVVLVAEEVDGKKGEQGENQGDGNITGDIRPSREEGE